MPKTPARRSTGSSPAKATARERVKRLAEWWGIQIADAAVCRGHHAPLDFATALLVDRPSLSLALGSRGSGKSFLTGLATHVDSIRYPRHGTRVLGGSLSQSEQVYNAIAHFDHARPGDIARFSRTLAHYRSGSDVSILSASPTSVRGPHVPTLRLDEIDEIESEIRESALGMCMDRGGVRAMVSMTSTWHRVGGPMAQLIDRARAGEFPLWTFCAFEVLERCPEERSGPNLEHCPACPLKTWCHDQGIAEAGSPKAKRSSGHYGIDSLIQKVRAVSRRVFEADYLCLGPKADGVWFKGFDRSRHVGLDAEFDPRLPVHLAIDSGVFTGAVWFQIHDRQGEAPVVTVFGDYLAEDPPGGAEANALAIRERCDRLCNGRREVATSDPAGGSRTAIGPTVFAEYHRAGLKVQGWPGGSVADGLALIESFVEPADGVARLKVHPRCARLIDAFEGYRRAKRAGQWTDAPEDPQHPHEDLMDALRGGLRHAFPEGKRPEPKLGRVPARRIL